MSAYLKAQVCSYSLMGFVPLLASSTLFTDSSFNLAIAPMFIGDVSVPEIPADIFEAFDRAQQILSAIDSAALVLDRLLWVWILLVCNCELPGDF